jgi:hypothetical protein
VITDPSAPLESLTEVKIADGHFVTLRNLKIDGRVRQRDVVAGSGSLTVINSTITGGVADHGAGINVEPGSGTAKLTVLRSTIANNLAFGQGGAIAIADAAPSARNSASVINSTIAANQANISAGAIKIGLYVSLTVRDSTIAGNAAIQNGGGLWVPGGPSTVTSPVALTNTILAANTANVAPDCQDGQGLSDGGHNLIGTLDANCPGITAGTNGDQAGTPATPLNPMLGQLASNGGTTQTLALQLGSPAISAGDPTDCRATPINNLDQRAHTRGTTTRLTCDTGAYDTGGQ